MSIPLCGPPIYEDYHLRLGNLARTTEARPGDVVRMWGAIRQGFSQGVSGPDLAAAESTGRPPPEARGLPIMRPNKRKEKKKKKKKTPGK